MVLCPRGYSCNGSPVARDLTKSSLGMRSLYRQKLFSVIVVSIVTCLWVCVLHWLRLAKSAMVTIWRPTFRLSACPVGKLFVNPAFGCQIQMIDWLVDRQKLQWLYSLTHIAARWLLLSQFAFPPFRFIFTLPQLDERNTAINVSVCICVSVCLSVCLSTPV